MLALCLLYETGCQLAHPQQPRGSYCLALLLVNLRFEKCTWEAPSRLPPLRVISEPGPHSSEGPRAWGSRKSLRLGNLCVPLVNLTPWANLSPRAVHEGRQSPELWPDAAPALQPLAAISRAFPFRSLRAARKPAAQFCPNEERWPVCLTWGDST